MSTIDRIFCNTELDSIFPLASSQALSRIGSDHTPIFWDSGISIKLKTPSYKFEKWWLLREDFKSLVEKTWSEPVKGNSPLDRWQNKVRKFRRVSKGWNKNIESELRKCKSDLLCEHDMLDMKAETEELSADERDRIRQINAEMQRIWLKEETKAKQRSRDRDIKEGDRNTAYFHAIANQRRRKTFIHALDGPDGEVVETKDMLKIATDFYKDLFKKEDRGGCSLSPEFFSSLRKKSLRKRMPSYRLLFLKQRSKKPFLTPIRMGPQAQTGFLSFSTSTFGR